jgi:hypothetical protein
MKLHYTLTYIFVNALALGFIACSSGGGNKPELPTTMPPLEPSTTLAPEPVNGLWCYAVEADKVPGDFSPCAPESALPKVLSNCSKLGEWKTGCKPVICKKSCL